MKLRTKLTALAAILGLGLSTGLMGQTKIFSEDFGEISDGTTLTTSNTGYDNVRNNDENAVALNPSTIGSGSSMVYGGAATTSNENFWVKYNNPVQEYDLTTSRFSVKFDDLSSGSWVYFEGGDTGNNFGNGTFQSAQMMWGIQVDGQQLRYRSSNDSWLIGGLPTLTADTQYDFHIVSNNSGDSVSYDGRTLGNEAMDIYLNGDLVGEGLSIPGNANSVGMKVYQISNSEMTFEFDNHEVFSGAVAVPEPEFYGALIGLAALGFVVYRRRKARQEA